MVVVLPPQHHGRIGMEILEHRTITLYREETYLETDSHLTRGYCFLSFLTEKINKSLLFFSDILRFTHLSYSISQV
jgi:hypothetical protein